MNRLTLNIILMLFTSVCNASIDIDIEKIEPGTYSTFSWLGLPIVVYKRTENEIKQINRFKSTAVDKNKYAYIIQHVSKLHGNETATALFSSAILEKRQSRSQREDILVVVGMTSYAGCYIEAINNSHNFKDPCSSAIYDTNGRINKINNREFYHLLIPPHYFHNNTLTIGYKESHNVQIIDFSPDIASMNIDNGEKLLLAIEWKKTELIQRLLKDPKVINYETKTGATALHVAARKSTTETFNHLLSAGLEVNKPTKTGITPIQIALLANNDEVVITLLKNNAFTKQYCFKSRCSIEAAIYISNIKPKLTLEAARTYIQELKENSNKTLQPDP